MADPDLSISNGTCFSASRHQATNNFIPCGNWVFGDYHCCQAGDYCLDDNACYNQEHGTTYLAGCTDEEYNDASCPDKKAYKDYPWAGLIYCKPNRWVACKETAKPYTITVGDPCTCLPDSQTMTVAFSAPSQITGIGSLPTSLGGTIEWAPGHFPTTEPSRLSTPSSPPPRTDTTNTASTTTTTTTPTFSISTLSTPTSSPPTPSATDTSAVSEGHHLSDGAKAGISVGSAIGGFLLLGALSALWMVFRRRRNDKNNSNPASPANLPGGPVQSDKSPGPAEMPTPEVPPRPPQSSELAVGPWVVRPELIGDVTPTTAAGYGYRAGVEGSVSPMESPRGWGQGQGRAGMAAPLSTVQEEREGAGWYVQQSQLGQHGQGAAVWASTGEGAKQGQGVVMELPA